MARAGDEASSSIEVMGLVAVICILGAWATTAFAFPTPSDPLGNEGEAAQHDLVVGAEDALRVWAQMPVTANDMYAPAWARERMQGLTHLEMLVADASGGGSLLDERLDQAFGSASAGLGFNVRLCRLTARWPDACTGLRIDQVERERAGTTIAFDQPLAQRARYVHAATSLDRVGEGAEVPVQAVSIAKDRRVTARVNGLVEARFLDTNRAEGLTVDDAPVVRFDSGALSVSVLSNQLSGLVAFDLEVGGTIPEQGMLILRVPAGWSIGPPSSDPPGWTWVSLPPPGQEGPADAVLARTSGPGDSIISLYLTPPTVPARAVDVLQVFFDGRDVHQAQSLAISYASVPTNAIDQRRILLNAALDEAASELLLGVVVVNGAETRQLESLDIDLPLDFVTNPPTWSGVGTEPSVAVEADGSGFLATLAVADQTMAPFEVREFAWTVPIDLAVVPALPYARYGPITFLQGTPAGTGRGMVTFENGHEEIVFRQGRSRGVFLAEVAPEVEVVDPLGLVPPTRYSGYPDLAVGQRATATVGFDVGGVRVTDEVTFEAATLDPDVVLGIRDALDAASVRAEPEVAEASRAGTTVLLRADWSSLPDALDAQGLGSLRDALKVYAPHSLGVAPTWSWESTESSGARHGITAFAFGDVTQDGVGDFVVASEDGNVVALSATGAELFTHAAEAGAVLDVAASGAGQLLMVQKDGTIGRRAVTGTWTSVDVAGAGEELTSVDFGGLPQYLVVGGSKNSGLSGFLRVVDAVTLTQVADRATVSAVQRVGIAAAKPLVDDDPWYAAALTRGDVLVYDIGGILRSLPDLVSQSSELQVRYGLSPEATVRVDVRDVDGGANEARLLTSWGRFLVVPAAGAVASTDPIPEEGIHVGAFVPDLTGDGVPDATLAGSVTVQLLNGRTTALVWGTPWVEGTGGGVLSGCDDGAEVGGLALSPCTTQVTHRAPLALAGDGSRVFLASARAGGLGQVAAYSAAGTLLWGPAELGPATTAHALAATLPVTGGVVATATSDGHVLVHTAPTGAPLWDEAVTALTGVFTYRLMLDPGAILGTYVLESELAWDQSTPLGPTFPQKARMLGVLDLTDLNDPSPTYALVGQGWQRDWKG